MARRMPRERRLKRASALQARSRSPACRAARASAWNARAIAMLSSTRPDRIASSSRIGGAVSAVSVLVSASAIPGIEHNGNIESRKDAPVLACLGQARCFRTPPYPFAVAGLHGGDALQGLGVEPAG